MRREYERMLESLDYTKLTVEEMFVYESDFLEMMRRRWVVNTSLNDPTADKT